MQPRRPQNTPAAQPYDDVRMRQAYFWWDYFWLAPWKTFIALIWIPGMMVGRIATRDRNIAASIRAYIEALQLVLAFGYTLFGVLYVLTCVAYELQYFGAMNIAFLGLMIPGSLLMIFLEFGIQLQKDPMDPKHFIYTWNKDMMACLRAAGEVYGTLIITNTMLMFLLIYDLAMNGIQRKFETIQDFTVYRFVGTCSGLMCLVVMGALYSNDTFRNRDKPAIRVKLPGRQTPR